MATETEVLEGVRKALASEARVGVRDHPLALEYAEGTLTIEGEVANVAAKKLALERAAAVPGVVGIIDRLRVAPAQPMGDGQVRDLVRDALLQEPALAEVAMRARIKRRVETLREPAERRRGWIQIEVADGVVTLTGEVPGLGHKRLAGVLAWWVPGSRDVVNGLGVEPSEQDSDEEITDAVRLVLEKDTFVDARQIRAATRDAVVTLAGIVPTDSEREMAEFDAWYVFGVNRVDNRIEVRPFPPTGG
jgi:osmotically-inducible protein OsmY